MLPRRSRNRPEAALPCPDQSRSRSSGSPSSSPARPLPERSSSPQPQIAGPRDATRGSGSDARRGDAQPPSPQLQAPSSLRLSASADPPTTDGDVPGLATL